MREREAFHEVRGPARMRAIELLLADFAHDTLGDPR